MATISYEANQIPQPNIDGTAWYVRGMKITGVAARLAKTTTKGRLYDFCKENRVAMTPAEQQVLAVKQPYMFPFETKCADGRKIFKDEILPMMMMKIDKELDPDKRVAMRYGCLHPYSEDHPVKIDVDDPEIYLDSNGNPSADYLYTAAVMRQHLYRNRHFIHGVLRERFDPKKHQHPDDCVISLVREEHHKRFKPEFLANSATFPNTHSSTTVRVQDLLAFWFTSSMMSGWRRMKKPNPNEVSAITGVQTTLVLETMTMVKPMIMSSFPTKKFHGALMNLRNNSDPPGKIAIYQDGERKKCGDCVRQRYQ